MSKMKKVISLVLCFAMLAGTFAFLGDLVAPAASAATGTSKVKTYAELDAAYDKFVYYGADVIEVENGEHTDGYVDAGDWLQYRITVLSDMYIGTSAPHIVFEKDFFDIRVITSTTPKNHDNYTNNDYEGNLKFTDGQHMNTAHPYAAPNIPAYHTLTAFPATKVAAQMGFCEIDAATYSNWDIVKANTAITATQYNFSIPMTENTWYQSFYVRVKEGLAEGETGKAFSPYSIWKINLNPQTGAGDTRRFADVYTADEQGAFAAAKSLTQRYTVVKALLVDDLSFDFTIGANPADNPEIIETKPVKFTYVDGTEIASGDYAQDAEVEVPAVDGLVAWVDDSGKKVELGESFTMGQKALTYVAVLDTDKFNVTINLVDGVYAEDAELPEGAEVVGGKLVIKAGFGEEVDLTALPLPEKEGYTGAWNPAKVKVESTRGANASITWTKATYKASFYLDKEAYEGGIAALREVTFVYGNTIPFANINVDNLKNDQKFVNWIDAATGEPADTTSTTYAENKSFYANWTNYNSTVTVWGRDYANGGWKAISTLYGDAGKVVKINDLKALVNEANFGTAAVEYVVAGPANAYDTNTAIRNDFAMVEGNTDIYLFTNIRFNVTLNTPVLDADGYITEEYKAEAKSMTSSFSEEDKLTTANILASAPAEITAYNFLGWEDAEGNVYPAGNIALDFANGATYEFTAKYELAEYTIEFAIDNSSAIKEIFTVEGTYTAGDTFKLSEMTIVKADGTEGTLPEIGKENAEQAGGPYQNVNGYKFTGWKVGTQTANLVDFDITTEVVLTPAVIKQVTLNNKIRIKGFWEALYYDFVAYYAKSYDAEGKPVYEAMPAVKVQTGASLDSAYAAAAETVKANLPEGKRFSLWKLEDGSSRPTSMPAYGVEVYATYLGRPLNVYIDYNYGTEDAPVDLETSMIKSGQHSKYLFDGVDVENDIPEGELLSIANMIRMSTVTEAQSPGAGYEVVSWKIYHVENEEDRLDKSKWHEGINDEGTSIAKSTLIFQVEWMAHSDFLFRVYNTEGALRSAIDKKFQKHFWYKNKPVDKESAEPLNALPERLILLGFMPKFEFDNGFAIRIDPITLSKAWLNPANWGALVEALIKGITSGFGGAI